MRFETRTLGVFEVLGVHLDADQTFDAGRLRQETLRLVEKGSRRIVVDLGQIDYLYSDSINAFVALNRRMLESSGRLGILVPHSKVHEILVRAGLENIMRLYRTEAELLGDSRELMRQSSAWTRPAELSSAASASQILSATNLIPRSGEPSREGASTQRIPRRRTGPRVELKSRRHDGRRQDQPSQDDAPLPPPLPGVGSESSSLRALSRESSSFGPPTPRTDWNPPPPNRAPAPILAEPTVFQLPQDPEQDGYSTDAWLLALTNQTATSAQRKDAEQDSSGFLPKLETGVAPPAPAAEDNPASQLDTGLRWEEEIPLTDGPVSRTTHPRPAPPPAEPPTSATRLEESPFATAFLDSPSVPGAETKPTAIDPVQNDALRAAIFHEFPAATAAPESPRSPVGQRPHENTVAQENESAEPTIVMPTANPSGRDFRRSTAQPQGFPNSSSPSSAEDWFGSTKRQSQPVPAAPPAVPPKAPVVESKPASPAEDWFGSAKRQPQSSPALSPAVPPKAPVVESKPASPAEDWFGSSKRQSQPVPAAPPAVPPKAPVVESKPASPAEDWFGSTKRQTQSSPAASPALPPKAPVLESKSASPAEDWFGSSKRQSQPVPAAPPAVPPKAPVVESKSASPVEDWFGSSNRQSPPVPAASPVAPPKAPAEDPKPTSPVEDWFAQPAPRVMASASDRPSETDAWFGKSSTLKHTPAPEPWRSTAPSHGGPRSARKSPLPSVLDEDEPRPRGSRGKGAGFWIAVVVGILLVLGGAAFWLFGLSDRHAAELPPVTLPAAEAPATASPTAPNPTATSAGAPDESAPGKEKGVSRPKLGQDKKSKPPTPVAVSPTPAPPPVEDHAPVKVFVTSRPSGASLSLDGTGVGTTPCEITVVRSGNLDFSLPGYRTLHQAIDPDEVRGTLNVQLLSDDGGASTGHIYISSAPSGADIVYGGKTLGKTPRLVELPTGAQKITVKSGVQSQTKTLDILSGTNPAENFSL